MLALLLVVSMPGCSWFGGEEDENAPAELVDIEPTLRIRKLWSESVGDGNPVMRLGLAPASDGTRIFAADHDGQIAAFDARRGKRLWRVKTRLALAGGPAVGAGLVAAGSSDGVMVALSAEDGAEQWRVQLGSEVLAPPAIARHVYVRTVDGKLVALDPGDGREVWFVQQNMPRLSVRGTGSPVVDRDRVICGFDNGRVAAYDVNDGSVIWDVLVAPPSGRTEVDRLSDLNATVRVIGDEVYAVSYQGRLVALARESGQILWSIDFSSYSGLGADLGNLYVSGDSGVLLAVERATGRELWRRDELSHRDLTAPTAYGSAVVVGDLEGYVHFFDVSDGKPLARIRAGSGRIAAAPLVVDEFLYVFTDEGDLVALRDATPARGN
jgi:outer membrane protein assembly factor BamB